MPSLDTGRISLFFEDAGIGGVPVLLLHELGGSSESWRDVVPSLATDRRVIAADFRCAGRSEKLPGAFTLADVADDLDSFLRTLRLTKPVDVIGAALGSLVGALLAIRHPNRVRRLMMCAVAPDMAGPTRVYVSERAPRSGWSVCAAWPRPAWRIRFRRLTQRSEPPLGRSISATPRRPMPSCRWRWHDSK